MSFFKKACNVLGGPIQAKGLDLIQVNLGYRCNMSCQHCHVEGGASDTREMSHENVAHLIKALEDDRIGSLDITGGAPELNPSFRSLVTQARAMGKRIIVRTNLTILFEPGMEDLADFYALNEVELIASLPCYTQKTVDSIRGSGTFDKSMAALKKLNALGYGQANENLLLNLVYNPQGAFLSPMQQALEADYRRELKQREGVFFNHLYTFTNMPIGRFKTFLERAGQLDSYMSHLSEAFNPCALDNIMCRNLISVGPDGRLYDCDFNLALGLALADALPAHISEFDYDLLRRRTITVDEHCHGCVAGQGST